MKKHFFLFLVFLSYLSFSSYAAELQFEMSLSPAFDNGYNITNASIKLTDNEITYTKDLVIITNTISCIFDDITNGTYSIEISLFNNNGVLITSGAGSGTVNNQDITRVTARLINTCGKLILKTNWHPDRIFSVDSLYNFMIDSNFHHLKTYDLKDVERIASEYKNAGMNWYNLQIVETFKWDVLDSNLVPLWPYSFGLHRNPVTTSQYAFIFYYYYHTDNQDIYKRGFINNANWLIENHQNYYLPYDFDWSHYTGVPLNNGWISAMAQGEALAVTSMAYHFTGEEKYLTAANGFFTTLYQNTESLWCFGVDNEDYYWLEEYPNKDFCHVLNGMLSGLWGLWDYYVITGNQFALTLFQAGIKTIADNYYFWNIKDQNMSRYCKHPKVIGKYHDLHLIELNAYDEYFDIPEFQDAIACFTNKFTPMFVYFEPTPQNYIIHQNYPNPFNSTTMITFSIPQKMNIKVQIYNQLGQKVCDLIDDILLPGDHQIAWDASGYSTGLYFYKIQCNYYTVFRKMLYIK